MDKSIQMSVAKLFGFSFLASLCLSLICRVGIPQLDIAVGLLVGWLLVDRAYVGFYDKMTLKGDLLLLASILVIVTITPFLVDQWCVLILPNRSCPPNLQKACLFSVIFAVGISGFSLWVWFRSIQWRDSQR